MSSMEAEIEYSELSRELHMLIAEGLDGVDGDALRDLMDPLWNEMNEEGRDRMRALSVELKAAYKKEE